MSAEHCLNCESPLEEHDAYCPSCGAHIVRDNLSARRLLHDSFATLIDWEEGMVRTFRDLIRDPGRVIRFYWEGGRRRYVEPLRYFFLVFIVYQLYILLTDQSLFFFAFMEGFHRGMADQVLTEEERQRMSLLAEISTVLFFIILPVMSVASQAAFSRIKRSYAEHVVLNSYLIGQVLLYSILFDGISSIPGMDTLGILLGFVLMGAYIVFALSRAFRVRIRTALAGMLFGSFIGFVLLAIFFGSLSAIVL